MACVVFSDTRMPWGRPWLTLVIDCLTRVIIGFYLSMDRPSAVAAGMALAMGMLPKQDYLASLGLPGRWPVHGKIRKVLCDNAKEFRGDRKSTRLNSSHLVISYAVFCLKKKTAFINFIHFAP